MPVAASREALLYTLRRQIARQILMMLVRLFSQMCVVRKTLSHMGGIWNPHAHHEAEPAVGETLFVTVKIWQHRLPQASYNGAGARLLVNSFALYATPVECTTT